MTTLSLDGDWTLVHFPECKHGNVNPDQVESLGETLYPAQVPGNVELDLVHAGALPEPFYAQNLRLLRPLETHEWWYLRDFDAPPGPPTTRWALVFEGLDTLATVWLNGQQVGTSANMLVQQRFEVTGALRPDQRNRLVIRLGSAINHARQYSYDASVMSWEQREEGLYLRKAPHVWGWDILPRAVSAGIWRPVRLESIPETTIEQIYYYTAEAQPPQNGLPGRALLGVRFQFRTPEPQLDGFAMRFQGVCDDHRFEYEWPVEFVAGGCTIPISGARLWWPKGYGEANLYTVTAQLLHHGSVAAERTDRIGLRQLALERTELAGRSILQEPSGAERARIDSIPDPQSHFLFRVNGEPIQARGTNWVPLDAFHSRDAQRVDTAVGLADELGCNIIRCWGGNVYESQRFFDLCDEKGILVWQDFAFACCRYPQSAEFLDRVRAEAEQVTCQLRNHASLAVWCGDNEIDMVYLLTRLSPEQNRLTREVIPNVLNRLDPFRHYVPSSPYVPPAVFDHPDPLRATPEQHLWGPRGYYKSPFYLQHSAHFIGEMGYHGCPNVESIRKFISPENVWPQREGSQPPWQNNEEWRYHDVSHWGHKAINRDRIQLMANQIKEVFGCIPEELELFALASQISQAEAKKFFIESTRGRKWATSGVIWWNVLDGWPQFSDAVVDYYFSKKLAYHYIRRSQLPVLMMLGEPGSGKYLPVIACNDTRQPADVRYRVWDATSGETVSQGEIHLPPNQNWQVGRIRTFASDQRLYLMEWETAGKRLGNHYVSGQPPFGLERYLAWLPAIAALPPVFDPPAAAPVVDKNPNA
jgi:beta-mannosidase